MLTSPPIGQAFAFRALNGDLGAGRIVVAEADAVRVAKIELGQIAVQMLLAAMLVDAFHAALEDRIEALDRVCVRLAANVLFGRMVDAIMANEAAARTIVVERFIGIEDAFALRIQHENLIGGAAVHRPNGTVRNFVRG